MFKTNESKHRSSDEEEVSTINIEFLPVKNKGPQTNHHNSPFQVRVVSINLWGQTGSGRASLTPGSRGRY